jgi:hypothetical protein
VRAAARETANSNRGEVPAVIAGALIGAEHAKVR